MCVKWFNLFLVSEFSLACLWERPVASVYIVTFKFGAFRGADIPPRLGDSQWYPSEVPLWIPVKRVVHSWASLQGKDMSLALCLELIPGLGERHRMTMKGPYPSRLVPAVWKLIPVVPKIPYFLLPPAESFIPHSQLGRAW